MSLIEPGRVKFNYCYINGLPHTDNNGLPNYHIQELRIYEDICKAYFTGQLIIETQYNAGDTFLNPGAPVQIGFEAPRSDGGKTKPYNEDFRIYSYDSKPRSKNSLIHTISLMGQEYYNDKSNVVQRSFSNIVGTEAAKQIHNQYMQAGHGGIRVEPQSLGLLAQTQVPHIVNNKKPIKAIHDILDAVVYAQYKTCAAVYYRDKYGHVISPLQYLIEEADVTESFLQDFALGAKWDKAATAYNQVHHLKPLSPPGEDRTGTAGSEIDGLFKSNAAFDLKSGEYIAKGLTIDSVIGNLFGSGVGFQQLAKSFKSIIKSTKYGGRQLMSIIDQRRQPAQVDKNGPGGFNTAEDRFITQLTYAPKYWVSVPMQTGLNVTCGERIVVLYPTGTQNNTLVVKTLFVPRLIHELRFTELSENKDRKPVAVQGITDFYGVDWGN